MAHGSAGTHGRPSGQPTPVELPSSLVSTDELEVLDDDAALDEVEVLPAAPEVSVAVSSPYSTQVPASPFGVPCGANESPLGQVSSSNAQ